MNQSAAVKKRLVESPVGTVLAVMLGVLWLVSMAVVDGHALSFYPAGWGLLAIIGVYFVTQLMGYKVVRISCTAWTGLLAGGYFLLRCLYSPSTVATWHELGLIVGAFVFYMAGVYAAQQSDNKRIITLLVVAVLLNAAAYMLMQDPATSVRMLGRPETSLIGPNNRNVSLFVYKNFAGLSFAIFGMLLVWYAVWRHKFCAETVVCLVVGVGACLASFYCSTRIIWLGLPLMVAVGAGMWVFLSVYQKKPLNLYQLVLLIAGGIGILVFVADLFMGHEIVNKVFEVNSHTRFQIWSFAWLNVADAPLCGYGAAEAQWVFSPVYPCRCLPNYVHNEYLQVWMDYGIVGVGLMFLLIFGHLFHGVRAMASEHVDEAQKIKIAMAFLCVVAMAAAALTDFVWHNFALVSLTAFACGILATPFAQAPLRLFDFRYWAPGSGASVRRLRAQSGVFKVLMLALALGVGCCIAWLTRQVAPAWRAQWEYDAMCANGESPARQRAFLSECVACYPDHGLADQYLLLSVDGGIPWPEYEKMLRTVLEHTPRQIFIAALLADVLDRQQRFEESEGLFRQYYKADGQDNKELYYWTDVYVLHLFAWGDYLLRTGQPQRALSLFLYGEQLMKSGPIPWMKEYNPERDKRLRLRYRVKIYRKAFVEHCLTELYILKSTGITPDHSWKKPLQSGGKPALYSRYMQSEN